MQIEDIKGLGEASEDEVEKLKKLVAEKAESAAQQLDKIHDYLKSAFDTNWEIVFHKTQVFILIFEDLSFEVRKKRMIPLCTYNIISLIFKALDNIDNN